MVETILSKTKNTSPKAVIFSDFMLIFVMSLNEILFFVLLHKISEFSDMICLTKVLRN